MTRVYLTRQSRQYIRRLEDPPVAKVLLGDTRPILFVIATWLVLAWKTAG
jgi:hypothetical protein